MRIIENLEIVLIIFTLVIYFLKSTKKSNIIKYILLLILGICGISLIYSIISQSSYDEVNSFLFSTIIFSLTTLFSFKSGQRVKEIDKMIKEQKAWKKIKYNINNKKLSEKQWEKVKENLYNYFRFFEFNSYDANIGKVEINIKSVSKKVVEIDVDHTLSNESEIYYYDIISRYESLKNNNFIDEVYLKYNKEFSNKIKLITRIIVDE